MKTRLAAGPRRCCAGGCPARPGPGGGAALAALLGQQAAAAVPAAWPTGHEAAVDFAAGRRRGVVRGGAAGAGGTNDHVPEKLRLAVGLALILGLGAAGWAALGNRSAGRSPRRSRPAA